MSAYKNLHNLLVNIYLVTLFILVSSFKINDDVCIKKTFNVLDFGAKGDGKTLDSPAIQRAIDSAAYYGNGSQVLIPGKKRYLVGTIVLKSDIELHIEEDAELFISTDSTHYINDAVIYAYDVKNLRITGKGYINGRDLEFMKYYDKIDEWWIFKNWRPKIFILTKVNNLEIRDISFGQAPFWGLHMLGCENVLVDNIKVKNNLEVPNCDGIDPDHCRNVVIQNCHIISGDDAIVIKATRQNENFGPSANILVRDCILETQDAGVKIGTETTQDIYNIVFENIKIITSSRGIAIQLRDEGNVHDITFKDIEFKSRYYSKPWWGRGEAISFTAIPRLPDSKIGNLYNIKLLNITGYAENSIRICGTIESRIKDVLLENVNITLNKTTKYEGGLFDNRPTRKYEPTPKHDNPGIFISYADNILLKNCIVNWGENRPEYYTNALRAENSTNIKLINFKGKSANPKKYKALVIDK